MTAQKVLNKIFSELEEEAYDSEYHKYDYKRANQIIRANIEELMPDDKLLHLLPVQDA